MYLSPGKFRVGRYGSDLDDLTDIEIAEKIAEASAIVDGYCSIPTIPQRHDFRGGSIVVEEHHWNIPSSPFDLGTRRCYPFHWPIKTTLNDDGSPIAAVHMFRIYVTNTQYVAIQPSDLFVQNTEQYIEVVSLAVTSSGLFNALIIPNVGLATPTVRLSYDYGYLFASDVDERLYWSDANTFRAQNQWWTPTAPVVKQNGTVVDPANYTVNADEGTITFNSDQPADDPTSTDVITATYFYRMPSEIGRATGLITAYLLGEADLVSRGMAGLSSMSIEEIKMQRGRQSGTLPVTVDTLDALVPAAAYLLAGFKQWRIAA